MNQKIKKYLISFIKYAIFFIVVINLVSYYKSLDLNKNRLEIRSFELLDGTNYEIEKDKPLLIHFWATWCPICALEEQNIETISKDYQVITIATQSGSSEEIKEYLEKNNLSFKVVNDNLATLSREFNIKAFPTTFIYDKNQNLKFSEVGYSSTFGLMLRLWWSN
ncbi:redoxin domain-containing protein [Aliarcobacter skirrowii]|uniref:redoxin domain-containing protein n=1 Tax=Aliarcobacter skirrowii TaxID=28200 RepID=UPI0021B18DD2|nr:redoxin domain-containing protein [Aliarcobacter skirrowii]MCT7446036.1 redoxin domain-containing protein [Aliarcobacter skirrowii]MDX4036910.1 redoxin domain-containing protein [Aliarcobacter skirrowii]